MYPIFSCFQMSSRMPPKFPPYVFTPDIYAWPLVRANLPLSELLPIPGRLPSPATVTMLVNDLEKDGWNLAFTMLVVRHADNAVLDK